jgi:peptide/nickel transport system permease protein
MIALLVRRLAISVPLLLAVSFVTFALVSLTPGDAAYTMLGARATPEQLATLRAELGLDRPLFAQYVEWLAAALRGDLGSSLITGQPVLEAAAQRMGPTLSLLAGAIVLILIVGVPLGMWSAIHGGRLARLVDSVSFIGIAIPNFILALLLIPVFAVGLHLLPPSGYVPPEVSPSRWALSLVLPVIALSFGAIGIIAKQARAATEDVIGREFVTVMRANGYPRSALIARHILKTAAVPILATMGVIMVGLLSGTVLIEAIFAVPGLGGLAVQASTQADIPVILGVTVVFALIVIVLNVVLDIAYGIINPKVSFR